MSFLTDLRDWATATSQQLIETKLFGKKAPAGGTAAPVSPESRQSTMKKWLPYGLIGGALIAALFVFKRKK
jgi:hypothetical protein